jgi:hypothetical protein
LAFESRDCLTLYNALRYTAGASRVKHLAPEKFFAAQAGRLLTNQEVIDYERKLKEFVEGELALDGAELPESVISRTIAALGKDADLSHLEDPLPEQFEANLLPFILELHKNNELVQYASACCSLSVDSIPAGLVLLVRPRPLRAYGKTHPHSTFQCRKEV